ncbi:MAG: N-acetyl-gamma-glutamyl-phosphate reductase [Xanthomonadales bacterium]|nr:N-acetyl-gamma-glutamyl-phosphate reductase [Xanthomonadales bacterium]
MSVETVVIGARGYTGGELLPLLFAHPDCTIKALGSSSAAGEPVSSQLARMDGCPLHFTDIQPGNLEQFPADLYVLALPNGGAGAYVEAIERHHGKAVIIDLSADFRFDSSWVYGQPERFEAVIAGAKRIANPGCYATGAQLALAPLISGLISSPVVFGISGFSGAGKTPSQRNDPAALKDNILPYALVDHVHEREVSLHVNHQVRLLPHVAPFFRGISLTISAELNEPTDAVALFRNYRQFYQDCPLVLVREEIPQLVEIRERHGIIIGGFATSKPRPQHVSLVCVLDNLLKGAATQVVQNMNLAFGLPPLTGLETGPGFFGEKTE